VCVSAGYVGVGVLLIRGFSHESWIIFVKIKNYLSIKSTDSEQENCHHTDGFGCWQWTKPLWSGAAVGILAFSLIQGLQYTVSLHSE
jgi:hypothetical protein